MYKFLSLTLFVIAALSFSSCNNDKENTNGEGDTTDTTTTETTTDNTLNSAAPTGSFSTAYGVLNGTNIKQLSITAEDFQADKVKEAMQATINGQAPFDLQSGQALLQQEIKKLQQNPAQKNINPQFWPALGTMIAETIKMQKLDLNALNLDEFMEGVTSVLNGSPAMDMQTAQAIYAKEADKANAAAAQGSIEEGKKFLAENAKKPGITVLPSGVQYKIMRKGTGAKPTRNNKVKVHYHGTMIDGSVFDSSVDRGQPATFGVTEVIPGWTEVLQLMPVGAKWKVFIPSAQAYGNRPSGKIPPGSTLIFEIELLGIVG